MRYTNHSPVQATPPYRHPARTCVLTGRAARCLLRYARGRHDDRAQAREAVSRQGVSRQEAGPGATGGRVASGSPVRDSGTRSTAPHVHCGSARSFSWPAWCWRHWSPFGSGYDFLCRQERRSTMRYETPAKTPRRRVARFSAGQVTLSELCRKFVTKPTARWTVAGLRAFRQVGPVLESSFDTSRTSRYSIGLRGVVCPDLQPP